MAAQHFFAKAWSLSFERFSKKLRDFVKKSLLNNHACLTFRRQSSTQVVMLIIHTIVAVHRYLSISVFVEL
jgi:hypothetical protein